MTNLTERDLDLIEVALESAAQSVQSGANLRTRTRDLDPLAAEYLHALKGVMKMRENDQSDPDRTRDLSGEPL